MRNFEVYILVFLAFTTSCKKAEDRACLKFVGDESTKIISLGKTDSLFLYDNLEYVLIPDTTDFIELKGGENLLTHIECSSYNNKLAVRNNNTCNFLRSYKKKVTAFIHAKEIKFIHFEGTEYLKNQDTLKSGELRLVIRDGAGPAELTIDNSYMSATVTHGWGDFTLHGKTVSAFFDCNTNSFCNTSNLIIETDLKVNSNTGGNMIVNADGANLHATIKKDGDILYYGEPNTIDVIKTGDGQLIKLN